MSASARRCDHQVSHLRQVEHIEHCASETTPCVAHSDLIEQQAASHERT